MISKKITISSFFVVLIFISSCKKDRICRCHYTSISSTDNGVKQSIPVSTYSYENKLTNVTKKEAHCNNGEEIDTFVNIQNGTKHTIVNTYKFECQLE